MKEESAKEKKITENASLEEDEFLHKEFHKRYGIAYQGLLHLRKVAKKIGTSFLEEIFYIFQKRK